MKIHFLLVVGLLVKLAHTAPSNGEVDAEENPPAASRLVKRGGYHRASVYTSSTCAGPAILDVENFGCEGVCHTIVDGYSIYLQQRTTANPKPTADLYFTTNCTGTRARHAGIWAKHLAGCTDIKSSTGPRWKSVYLWYNC